MSNLNNPPPSNVFGVQTDVSGSRAINGTVYQNTGSKPRLVVIEAYIGAAARWDVYCDATATPNTRIALCRNALTDQVVTFVVPSGYYYKVTETAATVTLTQWVETQ
jgi:hypothetical protein